MTFVNPEPLAPFADVIAAGEGESAGAGAASSACARRRDRDESAAPACRASAASTSRRSTTSRYAADGTHRRASCRRAGTGAPAGRAEGRASRRTDALDPPATTIFTPDTEFGSRFLIEVVRGCANLCRFCWAGYNYLPVRAFPTDRILELAARGAAALQPRRPGVDRALRPPGDRAHPAQPARDGLLDQPGVAAARRPDADRSSQLLRESGERSITIAPETGSDRLRRVINKTVTNDEILDARRADLRERHREPEALLHDRPPDRNRRGPRGDSRSDAADARRR